MTFFSRKFPAAVVAPSAAGAPSTVYPPRTVPGPAFPTAITTARAADGEVSSTDGHGGPREVEHAESPVHETPVRLDTPQGPTNPFAGHIDPLCPFYLSDHRHLCISSTGWPLKPGQDCHDRISAAKSAAFIAKHPSFGVAGVGVYRIWKYREHV